MADDTSKQGTGDRAHVAAGQGYEIAYFAEKHGISQDAARELVARVGNDREKLDAAASAAKGNGASSPKKTSARKSPATPARRPARQAAARPAPAVATTVKPVKRAAKTAPAAVTDKTEPARKRAAAAARTTSRDGGRSSATGGKRPTNAPSGASKNLGKAPDTIRSAATRRTAAVVGMAAAGLVTGLVVNLGRKAVVQAPSVMAGDWLDALKVEHKLALTIFDGLRKTKDTQPAKRTMLLIQLKHALGKHAFTEENVIYPALRDWGDKADADKLNHDHGYVKQYLYDLDGLDNTSPAFLEKIAMFRADLEAHIIEEEEAIFPPLHAALSPEKNAAITALANKEGFKLA